MVGCPLDAESSIPVADQPFQGGLMIWRGDQRRIYVLYAAEGRWEAFPDTYRDGDPEPSPPAGGLAPVCGFGKVWRENQRVRDALGFATAAERGVQGAVQEFERGRMLWMGEEPRLIWVLGDDGRHVSAPDTFRE
jgi:hypothetical protein